MRSSLLCLALLFASTCCETAQTFTITDVTTEMGTTESLSLQSSDYDNYDDSNITHTDHPTSKVAISSEPTTITTIPTTTTTKAAEPKVTCPTCVTCVQALVGDNSMLVILALAVACLFLLITTMALACKVCSLKREQGEYQPCHADDESHLANGKRTKTDTGGKNEDNAVMMTEVFSENETTATEEKGSKQEEDGTSTGSSKNSSEGKDGSDESPSGAAVNDDQANTDAMEAPKDPAVSETANVSDVSGTGAAGDVSGSGTGAAGEPASGSTEETAANVEG